MGYSLWGHKELDTAERLSTSTQILLYQPSYHTENLFAVILTKMLTVVVISSLGISDSYFGFLEPVISNFFFKN